MTHQITQTKIMIEQSLHWVTFLWCHSTIFSSCFNCNEEKTSHSKKKIIKKQKRCDYGGMPEHDWLDITRYNLIMPQKSKWYHKFISSYHTISSAVLQNSFSFCRFCYISNCWGIELVFYQQNCFVLDVSRPD